MSKFLYNQITIRFRFMNLSPKASMRQRKYKVTLVERSAESRLLDRQIKHEVLHLESYDSCLQA